MKIDQTVKKTVRLTFDNLKTGDVYRLTYERGINPLCLKLLGGDAVYNAFNLETNEMLAQDPGDQVVRVDAVLKVLG